MKGIISGCDIKTKDFLKTKLNDKFSIYGKISINEDFYTNLDCFLSLSLYEGYSLSTLEAMSLGIPVLSSNLNGVFYDAIKKNPKINLAEVKNINDIKEISDLIERILFDKHFEEQMIRSGFSVVRDLNWEFVANSYEKFYNLKT